MSERSHVDSVVAFYTGGRDHRGRTLQDVLASDDEWLESVHDYIQWVFPTRHRSGVNPYAPLVSEDTVSKFAGDPQLRERLRTAFARMLRFYGLRENGGRVEADRDRFDARARVWVRAGNHNHLRLTRIMESLSTLGLENEASALQRFLLERFVRDPDRVSPATLEFWKRAVQ